jgi:CRISPR/Cas system-associated exonuclease Cas4 (RecB family)
MIEGNYEIKNLYLYSMKDNKKYKVPMPKSKEIKDFEKLIHLIRTFNIYTSDLEINPKKCNMCIYKELCPKRLC